MKNGINGDREQIVGGWQIRSIQCATVRDNSIQATKKVLFVIETIGHLADLSQNERMTQ